MSPSKSSVSTALVSVLVASALAACASNPPQNPSSSTPVSRTHTSDEISQSPSAEPVVPPTQETATLQARVAISYDGGVRVLDANTLEEVADLPLPGYLRLNPIGNNRHISVSGPGGFYILDLGTWEEAHGDHSHYYAQTPTLSVEPLVAAEKPGHVISHDGLVAFFDDATATATTFDVDNFPTDAPRFKYNASPAHHGLLVPRGDQTVITTYGSNDERSTVVVAKTDGTDIANDDNCPGVHGEAIAQDAVVTVGCEDGIMIVQGNTIQKVKSPDAYGRIGNQSGSVHSPWVLGDYKSDPDAELERPTKVSLTNVHTGKLSLVDLPSSYYFRSLQRDSDGTPLVFGTDGQLHVIDENKAAVESSIPVTSPWEESLQWQDPHPDLLELGGTVYVSAPHEKKIYAVDVETGKVWNEMELNFVSNEISGAVGQQLDDATSVPEAHDSHDSHDEESHSDDELEHGEHNH